MELMQPSRQWASRPADQRFTSLTALAAATRAAYDRSVARVVETRELTARPVDDGGLAVCGPDGSPVGLTNWAFGQLAQRASAPAGYLRDLPAELAADCVNYGLRAGVSESVGVLLRKDDAGMPSLHAMTSPTYGRIWNASIADALVRGFGDGVTGPFRVPGEFGKQVTVTNENTTLYASDRDMFVFLADETHRIEVPNRRDGKPGSMARGVFVWNSEVGAATLGIATFLFDYVCCNRIVWGAAEYKEIKLRHSSGAPARWIADAMPRIEQYANSSAAGVTQLLVDARAKKIGDDDAVKTFLHNRFSKSEATAIVAAHWVEENRPIESLWDATTAVTAYAKTIPFQDKRVAVEREGGRILALAA